MHAEVYILDRNLERLRQVDHHFRGGLETVASSTHAIEEVCVDADIVIGAVLVVGAKAPKLISDELVGRMRDGSVLVDISVDQGGCFESTRPTTHSDPTFEVNGSLFYCVANMPGAVPHSSTHALVNATLPYVLNIANHGWKDAVSEDPALAEGVNVVDGTVVYEPVAEAHGMDYPAAGQVHRLSGRTAPAAAPHRRCRAPDQLRSPGGTVPGPSGPRGDVPGTVIPSARSGAATGSSRTVRQGHHAGPDVEAEVVVVVVGRPVTDLDRGLVEGEPQHGRLRQLLDRGRPGVAPLSGHDVLADGLEGGQLLRGVSTSSGRP